jgi:hypothetical protein
MKSKSILKRTKDLVEKQAKQKQQTTRKRKPVNDLHKAPSKQQKNEKSNRNEKKSVEE